MKVSEVGGRKVSLRPTRSLSFPFPAPLPLKRERGSLTQKRTQREMPYPRRALAALALASLLPALLLGAAAEEGAVSAASVPAGASSSADALAAPGASGGTAPPVNASAMAYLVSGMGRWRVMGQGAAARETGEEREMGGSLLHASSRFILSLRPRRRPCACLPAHPTRPQHRRRAGLPISRAGGMRIEPSFHPVPKIGPVAGERSAVAGGVTSSVSLTRPTSLSLSLPPPVPPPFRPPSPRSSPWNSCTPDPWPPTPNSRPTARG